ncbi:MAG: hypothetical protein ACNI3A_05735 [Desulfovibrio sp.]|uniref:hypothetical protein n=1 Tax=Desulfovibrio sp. 7SRBS1 TaxID=3378064 RepID=UPI003B3FA004
MAYGTLKKGLRPSALTGSGAEACVLEVSGCSDLVSASGVCTAVGAFATLAVPFAGAEETDKEGVGGFADADVRVDCGFGADFGLDEVARRSPRGFQRAPIGS